MFFGKLPKYPATIMYYKVNTIQYGLVVMKLFIIKLSANYTNSIKVII